MGGCGGDDGIGGLSYMSRRPSSRLLARDGGTSGGALPPSWLRAGGGGGGPGVGSCPGK